MNSVSATRTKTQLMLVSACITAWAVSSPSIAKAEKSELDFDAARSIILEQMRKNESGITSCVLHWTRTTNENEYVWERKGTTSGTYSMYWDGTKTAAQSKQSFDSRKSDTVFDPMELVSRSVWDGREFRTIRNDSKTKKMTIFNRPGYGAFENYFEIAGWHRNKVEGGSQLSSILREPEKHFWNIYNTRTIPANGPEFVQIVAASRADGGGRIQWKFDPNKCYSLVSEEHYDGEDRLYVRATWTYEQVVEGIWFATALVHEFRDVETNKVTLRHEFAVDKKQSKFNQPSAIPDEAFAIKTEPGMEISYDHGEALVDPGADAAIMLYSRVKEKLSAKGNPLATSSPTAIMTEWEVHPPDNHLGLNLAIWPLAITH